MPSTSTATTLFRDLKTLFHLTLSRVRGTSHSERLESFYGPQAAGYDSFRSRLLHGRQELIDTLEFPDQGTWIDIGAGTGENAERLGPRLKNLKQVYQVDLCPSLLKVAQQRVAQQCWQNVQPVHADATTFACEPATVDVITFSYSLTMIPDWFAAIENAWQLLKPGGTIGVVDFYVARKYPAPGRTQHGWGTRTLWPLWFAGDNVNLNPDHIPYLQRCFEQVELQEKTGSVPYLPLVQVPYYVFIGRK
ncbi:class I SAM-dependent methyltransferase [Symmachiella dynata]|uniref:class I SAM-dependent methyltransferase n=1 Tax=Symmachiella dynata TaxID=2527995 RepID=UPI0030EBEA19